MKNIEIKDLIDIFKDYRKAGILKATDATSDRALLEFWCDERFEYLSESENSRISAIYYENEDYIHEQVFPEFN